MSKFTASNGVEIRVERDFSGDIYLTGKAGGSLVATGNLEGIEALREFFQHERDQELGRWRWPENPNWVAYPNEGGDTVTVLDETYPDEWGFTYRRGSHFLDYPHAAPAAKAYFAAHPKPKPWHEAVEGEVWLLMFPNSTQAWFVNGGYFQNVRTLTNINKTDPGITAARRIWPEDSNDS